MEILARVRSQCRPICPLQLKAWPASFLPQKFCLHIAEHEEQKVAEKMFYELKGLERQFSMS